MQMKLLKVFVFFFKRINVYCMYLYVFEHGQVATRAFFNICVMEYTPATPTGIIVKKYLTS